MKATSVLSDSTRIIPASRDRKVTRISKNPDGSMDLVFGNGETGTLPTEEREMQAFVIWTLLNSDCTRA